MNNLVYNNKFNENMKKFRGISKGVDKLNFKLRDYQLNIIIDS